MKLFQRFRSAITGRFVTKLFALLNKSTTVAEKVKPDAAATAAKLKREAGLP